MREAQEWKELEIGPGVRLLLGWRAGRRDIDARPVDLGEDVAEEMLEACRRTLGRLADSERRVYTGVPALEENEYLSLPLEDGEEALEDDSEAVALAQEIADSGLLSMVNAAFENDDFLTRDQLQQGGWLFYAVVVEQPDGDPVAFVRQYNPQRGFSAGRLLAAFHDTLTRFDDPLFNFDLEFDVVVAPDEVAIMRVTPFERVFSDIDLAAAQVPERVTELAGGLTMELPDASQRVLETICKEKAALARRLRRVARTSHLGEVSASALKDALEKHDLSRNRFGSGDALEIIDAEDVVVLLDMLEQLYYEADFTGEHRRADRYSQRRL